MKRKPRVALVHDYLDEFGGAERVLLALSRIYPEAPIYTIYARKGSFAWEKFKDKRIVESWFARLPFSHRIISPLRFLLPLIWGSFDFSDYDLVITSAAWAVTKGVGKGRATREVCYLHTPPRYLYGYDASREWGGLLGGFVKVYACFVNPFMRWYDRRQARRVDFFIVNSKNVGGRVEKIYGRRDYRVIYPPVDVEKFLSLKINDRRDDYYLCGGRLDKHKNFGLIIKACKKAGVNLKIFGLGNEEENLKKLRGEKTEFLGRVADNELIYYYRGAKAFLVSGADEDFGITPIEAAASGCPTIAYKGGGYLESVVEGKTGIFFEKLTVGSVAFAIKKFERMKFNEETLRAHAKKFSEERFEREIKEVVGKYA